MFVLNLILGIDEFYVNIFGVEGVSVLFSTLM